jgi:hypothetical protein
MNTATFISSTDLEDRLETWRERAVLFRDRHEAALIHGKGTTALAIDFGADELERCIGDIQTLIRAARGEEVPSQGEEMV